VVAVQGAEGAEHGPAGAELLSRVQRIAADVTADHRDLVDRRHAKEGRDRDAAVWPVREVVAEPLADFGARAGEGAARDDDGAAGGTAREHGLPALGRHHGAEEIVRVVHDEAVCVDSVDVDCVVGYATCAVALEVADGIRGDEKIVAGKALHGTVLSFAVGGGCGGGLEGWWEAGDGSRWGMGWWRRWREALRRCLLCWVAAGVVAGEVGGFVHVDPKAVNVNSCLWVEEYLELVIPIACSCWVEPVGPNCNARPDNPTPWSA
jgi:hypothetical protein